MNDQVVDRWSMDESSIHALGDDSISSFVEHRVHKAVVGTNNDFSHDRDDTYTSISSTTSGTDAMAESQLELAQARLLQANALADIARLKVAMAAKKAASASSDRSRSRLEGKKPITFVTDQSPRRALTPIAVINDMQEEDCDLTGHIQERDTFENDLTRIMDEGAPVFGPEVAFEKPTLLPSPPRGASEERQKPFVPPPGLNAEVLREFTQKQEDHERFVYQKANEHQQKVIQEAEQQVLRLQYALRVETEGHFANAEYIAAEAENKVFHVEQLANAKIVHAEEFVCCS
jgi:hypothetical protein